ncbi:hypothetical protein KAR28_05035 [Candidatus Parcubacteria bacterium]|nr:hypothetical protein [Candidatus Parcubacteria bacterium]
MFNFTKFFHHFHLLKQKSRQALGEIINFLSVKIYLGFMLAVNLLVWILAAYIFTQIDRPMMALHYSVDFGIDHYGESKNIFIIPILGLIFIVFNTALLVIVGSYNKRDIKFLAHLLLVPVLIANIMLLAAVISVYLINFQ